MQSKNKTRIKNIEESLSSSKREMGIAIKWIDGDGSVIKHNGNEYVCNEEEFKKLYPGATILKVEFID